MRYIAILLLVGCSDFDSEWEYQAEMCYQQGGTPHIEHKSADETEVYCQLPEELIKNSRVCYAMCKPLSEICPQVDCE